MMYDVYGLRAGMGTHKGRPYDMMYEAGFISAGLSGLSHGEGRPQGAPLRYDV